jgi:hypothetical protein
MTAGKSKHRSRGRKPSARVGTPPELDSHGKPRQRTVQRGIADADKVARTGSEDEPVRNTPPAGAWNDVSGD